MCGVRLKKEIIRKISIQKKKNQLREETGVMRSVNLASLIFELSHCV